MDREAAVIRSEMTQTRLELDSKLAQLESRAREFTPRRYMRRHMPDRLLDRVIGSILTMTGMAMAWHRLRERRRVRVRTAMASYGRW